MENEEKKSNIESDIQNEEIRNLIYTIRGKQVMIDSDVAMLYHYETKKINQSISKKKCRKISRKFLFSIN